MLVLFGQAIGKFIAGVILVGLLIFLPAGTLHFPNGWLFMGVLFIPIFIMGLVLLIHNPELLQKRLNAKEQQKEQSLVVRFSGLIFIIGFVLAGLDFRFQWFVLPEIVSWIAVGVFLLGYLLYAEVLRENVYLSRTIEVQENHKVIDSGLYRVVRHPMYSAVTLMFLAMPLVLGSLISFVVFLLYPFVLAIRIKHEEQFLEAELPGYREYKEKVKYRLIPFIW